MMPRYYRNAAAAIVVYDITSYESFQFMRNWVEDLTQFEVNAILAVAGNKCDLEEKRKVCHLSIIFILILRRRRIVHNWLYYASFIINENFIEIDDIALYYYHITSYHIIINHIIPHHII